MFAGYPWNEAFINIYYLGLFFVGDFQFASLDRKIIELYDDLMSQVSNPTASRGNKKNFK